MRGHLPNPVDAATVIALVLMVVVGAMALQKIMTTEQPGMAPDIQLRTVRY